MKHSPAHASRVASLPILALLSLLVSLLLMAAPATAAPHWTPLPAAPGVRDLGDGGASWLASNQGILALGVSSLAVTPVGTPTVVAVAGQSVYHSTDQGATSAARPSRR